MYRSKKPNEVDVQDQSTGVAEQLETARAKGVAEGLQEAAFICEGYAARLAEGDDHHAEYDAVCECFALIDQRICDKAGGR